MYMMYLPFSPSNLKGLQEAGLKTPAVHIRMCIRYIRSRIGPPSQPIYHIVCRHTEMFLSPPERIPDFQFFGKKHLFGQRSKAPSLESIDTRERNILHYLSHS